MLMIVQLLFLALIFCYTISCLLVLLSQFQVFLSCYLDILLPLHMFLLQQSNQLISIFRMSNQGLPIFKVTPQNRKLQEFNTLQNIGNKRVITSLKEQMNNIRQGMSKLLRVKSQQNISIYECSSKQQLSVQNVDKEKAGCFEKNEVQKQRELEQKIKKLEQQNMELRTLIKKMEEQHRRTIEESISNKQQIQKQKQRLLQRVQKLSKQILGHSSNKKQKKPAQVALKCMPQCSIQSMQNPQYIYIPPIVNQTLILMQQEKHRMLKDINIMQIKLKAVEGSFVRTNKLIFLLNEQVVKEGLKKMSLKYQAQEEKSDDFN